MKINCFVFFFFFHKVPTHFPSWLSASWELKRAEDSGNKWGDLSGGCRHRLGTGRGRLDVWRALLTFFCAMVFLLNLKSFDFTGLRWLENINKMLISESDLIKNPLWIARF